MTPPLQAAAATGFIGFCASMSQDPRVSFGIMTLILLTCVIVLAHVLISCWISNKKALKKREVRRGRTTPATTRPQ